MRQVPAQVIPQADAEVAAQARAEVAQRARTKFAQPGRAEVSPPGRAQGSQRAAHDPGAQAVGVGAFLLPATQRVLAVVARPGQESAGLGGLLHAFRQGGATVALLSVTHGEASPLNATCEHLESVRPWELLAAAGVLRISAVAVADFPDGRLSHCPVEAITERVEREMSRHRPDLLLMVDPFMAGPDEAVVAQAACAAAERAGVPAVAGAVPGAGGGWLTDLGAEAASARAIQRAAAAAHRSQAEAMPAVRRHISSLGRGERLRWLVAGSNRDAQALGRVSVS